MQRVALLGTKSVWKAVYFIDYNWLVLINNIVISGDSKCL